jgi:hypothetical protein
MYSQIHFQFEDLCHGYIKRQNGSLHLWDIFPFGTETIECWELSSVSVTERYVKLNDQIS